MVGLKALISPDGKSSNCDLAKNKTYLARRGNGRTNFLHYLMKILFWKTNRQKSCVFIMAKKGL